MPEILHMPKDSRGHRAIHQSSNASCRHVVVHDGYKLFTESSLESHVANALMAMPTVKSLREQYPRVSYTNACNEHATHTFDLFVEMADGVKLAIAVKPWELAQAKQFFAQLNRIAAFVPPNVADAVILVTDRALTEAQRKLNRAIASACRDYPCAAGAALAADRAVVSLAERLSSAVTLDEFARALPPLDGQGFRATLRAIKAGHLEVECAHLEIGRTRVRRHH